MKKCAYCIENLNKQNRTKEHIIPARLIELFLEQDISFSLKGVFKDNDGISIKDVCNKCNNGFLSQLDEYGISVIKENFTKRYFAKEMNHTLKISFDYNKLSRWLIKIAYNYSRFEKNECEWFLKNIKYIKGETGENNNFSLYAGLHIDMIPTTEECFGYMPLEIYSKLKFKPYGFYKYGELLKGNLIEDESEKFKLLHESFLFRFGSIRFLLFLWEKEITEKDVEYNDMIMSTKFSNYTKVLNKDNIVLQGVTDAIVCRLPNIIHGDIGNVLSSQFIGSIVRDIEKTQGHFKRYFKENKGGRILIEALIFPDNEKVQKEYREYYKRK